MRYTWANAFVLLLATGSLVTGYYAFVAGEPDQAWHVSAHRIAGLAVVAVLFWKLPNVARPLARRYGAWTAQDYLALTALVLLLIDILLGVAWAHLGRFSYLGTSGMTWHAIMVFLIVPMIVLHLARYRRLLRPRYWAQRRSVLRLGGLALIGVFLWQAGIRLSGSTGVAQAKRFTGSYAASDFSGNSFPTTSWLNDRLGAIDPDAWTLTIAGAVDSPLIVAYADLEPTEEETAALDCTGGWHSTQHWSGVRLGRLLAAARPQASAASVTVTSATGLLPALLSGSRGGPAARDARRRRAAFARPRRAAAAGRAGQARVRVGQVGHAHRREHDGELAPAPAAVAIARSRHPAQTVPREFPVWVKKVPQLIFCYEWKNSPTQFRYE